jgi:hypothetical protein
MIDARSDRGVDVEKLSSEIEDLRSVALRYAEAAASGSPAEAGLELEAAAVRYVRKLDEEVQKTREVDYLAIFEKAETDRDASSD